MTKKEQITALEGLITNLEKRLALYDRKLNEVKRKLVLYNKRLEEVKK